MKAGAGRAAAEALGAAPELAPIPALETCHRALSGTPGAALAIAQFDPATGRLACIGVGNVAAQLIQGGRVERPGSLHGVVGATVVVARAASVEQAAEVR